MSLLHDLQPEQMLQLEEIATRLRQGKLELPLDAPWAYNAYYELYVLYTEMALDIKDHIFLYICMYTS